MSGAKVRGRTSQAADQRTAPTPKTAGRARQLRCGERLQGLGTTPGARFATIAPRDHPSPCTGAHGIPISEPVVDRAGPDRLAVFWSEVLGYVELSREDGGTIEIGPPDAGFGGAQPPQDAELERLLALGALPVDVGQDGTENWHVLADPDGNGFCLLHAGLRPR